MLKKVSVKALIAAWIVGSCSWVSGYVWGSAAPLDPIRIGTVLALSGPVSWLGQPALNTLELYIDEINARGGLLGRPIELVHYDSQGKAGIARTYVRKLIREDRVDLIIGGSTSGASVAVIPLVEKEEVPFISLAAALAIVDPVHPWVFKTPHTDRMAVEKIFTDMGGRGLRRVALISGDDGFGRSGRKQVITLAAEYGITIVADERYGPRDADMTAQLDRIRQLERVDAVLVFGFGEGPAVITRNYKALGMRLPLYQSHGVAAKNYIELAGSAAEGVRLPAAPLLVADRLPDAHQQKPVIEAYRNAYEGRYGRAISTFGGHAYDGLMLAVSAIKAAGTTERHAVRDALENIQGFIGTAGEVNMSASDHLGLSASSLKMLEIRNGSWVLAE